MLTFESLPVELISDILGQTDIKSLVGASLCVICRYSEYLSQQHPSSEQLFPAYLVDYGK